MAAGMAPGAGACPLVAFWAVMDDVAVEARLVLLEHQFPGRDRHQMAGVAAAIDNIERIIETMPPSFCWD